MDKRDELIFWFDQPPKVSKGAFNYVSKHWGNKVIFIVGFLLLFFSSLFTTPPRYRSLCLNKNLQARPQDSPP